MKKSVLNYRPAQLSIQKNNWEVTYYTINPSTNVLVRKRIKLNHIESKVTRRQYAFELIRSINQKLAEGWNPFIEDEAPRSFELFIEATQNYIVVKTKELRESSIKTYISTIKIFSEWLSKKFDIQKLYIYSIDNTVAQDFMHYLYVKRNLSERKYNGFRSDLTTLWNWFVENGYSKSNVFSKIKKKREREKDREVIDDHLLDYIFDYLKNNDIYFYAISCLCYYGLMRPTEILQLKKDYIDMQNNVLILPANITKSGKKRIVTMSQKLKDAFLNMNIDSIPKNYYIFSNMFLPGTTKLTSKAISRKWERLRDKINIPKNCKFYSLKDTGIVKMLKVGIPPNVVRDQAGHQDLHTTNIYIKMISNGANQDIIDKM